MSVTPSLLSGRAFFCNYSLLTGGGVGAYRISPHEITRDPTTFLYSAQLTGLFTAISQDAQTHKYTHLDTYYEVKRMCNGSKDCWAVKDLATAEDGCLAAGTPNNGIQIF